MPILGPIRKYQPLWAYHHYYDNLPIDDIEEQLFVINAQVDLTEMAVEDAVGTSGTLATRLDQSLESDGSLKTTAIDDALHDISAHLDAGGYVRMTDGERAKLSLIEDAATNLSITVSTVSTTLVWPFVDETFVLADSDSIAWRYDSGRVLADTTFDKDLITIPAYNQTPVLVSGAIYRTPSSIPFEPNSLRVYINGLRLNTTAAIGGYTYTETDPTIGRFTLNQALAVGDVMRIDFDRPTS